MSLLLGQILPFVLYALVGLSVLSLLRWRGAQLFDILIAGYLVFHLPFVVVAWTTEAGGPSLWMVGILIVVIIAMTGLRRPARMCLTETVRSLCWEDAMLFFGVAIVVGWPFLGTSPSAPWGPANEDLVDSFEGGNAILNQPELVQHYKKIILGSSNFGQYASSALSFVLSGRPLYLLSDYWNLLFLFSLLSLGIATLVRDGLKLSRIWSLGSGALVGVSCLLTTTFYNGHVGSTMFLPLVICIIRMLVLPGGASKTVRITLSAAALLEIVASYLYPAPFFLAGAVIAAIPWLMGRPWMPGSVRRIGTVYSMLILAVIAVTVLIVIYPYFAELRHAISEKTRSWPISLRPEMLGIALGADPTGLCWTSKEMSPLLPRYGVFICAIFVIAISVIGLIHMRVCALGIYLIGFVCAVCCMGCAIAVVITDPYYFYKVIYLSWPFIAIAFVAGASVIAKSLNGVIAIGFFSSFLLLNLVSTGTNAIEFSRAPFNVDAGRIAAVAEPLTRIRSSGTKVQVPNTGWEYSNFIWYIDIRFGLGLNRDKWRLNKDLRSQLELALANSAIARSERSRQIRALADLADDTPVAVVSKRYPEILRFWGSQDAVLWGNSVWDIVDRSASPVIDVYQYSGDISRYPFALHDRPFRWMRDKVSFLIDRWPPNYRRLTFYAQAGYGSTSGLFDLRVLCNGNELVRQTVGVDGVWIETLAPPSVGDSLSMLEFTGSPLPGPPPAKREYLNMRARIAEIRVRPLDAPRWDRDELAIMNAPDDVADVPGPNGGAALGPGWGPREVLNGKPLHWITERPATIVILGGKSSQTALRLVGGRGPAGAASGVIEVHSSSGWTEMVAIREDEIVIPLHAPPLDGCEVLTLAASNGDTLPITPGDDRRLVFRLDKLDISP